MELIKSLKSSKIIKYAFIALIGSIALAISSKIKIPFYPVPMTMQTFIVLSFGVCFGYKIGLATVGLYLVEGIIGLPVFSNSPERGVGLVYFTGPTMGYLIGLGYANVIGDPNDIETLRNTVFSYFSEDSSIPDSGTPYYGYSGALKCLSAVSYTHLTLPTNSRV